MKPSHPGSNRKTLSLGEILVQEKMVSPGVIQKALEKQKELSDRGSPMRLGELLVHYRKLDRQGLQRVLKLQQSQGQRRLMSSRSELEQQEGSLTLRTHNRTLGKVYVEDSATHHILVTETTEGYPRILVTEHGRTVLVNQFTEVFQSVKESYQASTGEPVKPRTLLVSPDVIELYREEVEGEVVTSDESTKEEELVKELIRTAYEANASDIHFFRGPESCRVRLRIYGQMRDHADWPAMKADSRISVMFGSLGSGGKDSHWKKTVGQRRRLALPYNEFVTIGGRYEHAPGDDGQYHAAVRLMANDTREVRQLIDLEELGFTRRQAKMLKAAVTRQSGMVIFSGPTGSGKTTTLAALVKWLNRNDDQNILTVESPIERELPAVQTSVSENDDANQKEFANAIKSMLRRDPDQMMVGEIRDDLSAVAAATGVQTGHLLLSTVHAQSAFEIVERLTSPALKIPRETVASPNFISALVYQMLLPELDAGSKKKLTTENMHDYLDEDLIVRLERVVPDINKANICIRGSRPEYPEGISGMTICAEVVVPDLKMRSLFRELKLTEALQHWRESGEQERNQASNPNDRVVGFTAMDHAISKMISGKIDPRDVEGKFGMLSMQSIMDDGVFSESEAPDLFVPEYKGDAEDTGVTADASGETEYEEIT